MIAEKSLKGIETWLKIMASPLPYYLWLWQLKQATLVCFAATTMFEQHFWWEPAADRCRTTPSRWWWNTGKCTWLVTCAKQKRLRWSLKLMLSKRNLLLGSFSGFMLNFQGVPIILTNDKSILIKKNLEVKNGTPLFPNKAKKRWKLKIFHEKMTCLGPTFNRRLWNSAWISQPNCRTAARGHDEWRQPKQ